MITPNYIGVVDDGKTVTGTFLYRVNYGDFAVQVESSAALTISECVAMANNRLSDQSRYIAPPDPTTGDMNPATKQYLIGYYMATRLLITLTTGIAPTEWIKLEDTEYETMQSQAMTVDFVAATKILNKLTYCFFQLKLLGYDWEDFAYPSDF